MAWDPGLYCAFAGPRLRPAEDLLARIPLEAPDRIVDLGCGTGSVTRLLARRWPNAQICGVDSSPEMLEQARKTASDIAWIPAGIDDWAPDGPCDLIVSNAALHWLDDHGILFPRLLTRLAPGGVLAVQMPRNHHARSHQAMAEAAAAGPWREMLAPLVRRFPVAEPAFYHRLLAPLAAGLDLWETEYLHVLEGDNPVVAWTSGTALRPLLAALDEPWRRAFLAEYGERIRAAYPPEADGRTLFAFRRLFLVATALGIPT